MSHKPPPVLLVAVLACYACGGGERDTAAASGGSTGLGGNEAGALSTGGAGGGTSGGESAGRAGREEPGVGGDVREAEARFVPQLQVSALPGGRGVFDLTALTVRKVDGATQAFATVLNDGEVPACSGSMTLQFFDADEVALDIGIGALLAQHFFVRTDGSNALAACVGPGDVSVVAITDLDPELRLADIRSVVYRTTYFALDVVASSGGLPIDDVKATERTEGTAYVGTLSNRFDMPIYSPTATVYPVNRLGRVLGMAVASTPDEVAPGGDFRFETNAIPTTPSVGYYAFPTARFAP